MDAPAQDRPYLIDSPDRECPDIIVSNCGQLISEAVASSQLAVITLRDNDSTREGALIACLPAGAQLELPIAEAQEYAEIFVLEGEIQLQDGAQLGKQSHAFTAGPAAFEIASVEPATLMLNYHGAGLAGEFAQQAQSVHRAPNAYP